MLPFILKLSVALLLTYSAVIGILSLDTPQRCLMFLHWVRWPFAKFESLEYYGFGHNMGRHVSIQTKDNVTIGAWHFLPKAYYDQHQLRYREPMHSDYYDDALGLSKYDTVVYFHGNALDRTAPWRVDFYKQLSNQLDHVHIIAIDYRGFGDSASTPSEHGLQLDAQATLIWLNKRNVPNHRISLIGHSLGTGVATTLAHDMAISGQPAKSLILKAGYSSMTTLVFEYNVIPFFPLLSPIKKYFPPVERWLLSRLNHKFDSLSKIQHVQCPILIIYGLGDLEIPVTNSHMLFRQALSMPHHHTISDLVDQKIVQATHILHEATVYHTPSVSMVELTFGDHNNIGYFDLTFQKIKEMLV